MCWKIEVHYSTLDMARLQKLGVRDSLHRREPGRLVLVQVFVECLVEQPNGVIRPINIDKSGACMGDLGHSRYVLLVKRGSAFIDSQGVKHFS